MVLRYKIRVELRSAVTALPFYHLLRVERESTQNNVSVQNNSEKVFWAENCASNQCNSYLYLLVCVLCVQCVTNFVLLLLMFLCCSFLFILCESSSKLEIAGNV